jgi:hypothetical protein
MVQTAVESLIAALLPYIDRSKISDVMLQDIVVEHLEMEKREKNNLPINIHEGISSTIVEIIDAVVHVKPNENFKVSREQALGDMMRDDEELGIYKSE